MSYELFTFSRVGIQSPLTDQCGTHESLVVAVFSPLLFFSFHSMIVVVIAVVSSAAAGTSRCARPARVFFFMAH